MSSILDVLYICTCAGAEVVGSSDSRQRKQLQQPGYIWREAPPTGARGKTFSTSEFTASNHWIIFAWNRCIIFFTNVLLLYIN